MIACLETEWKYSGKKGVDKKARKKTTQKRKKGKIKVTNRVECGEVGK